MNQLVHRLRSGNDDGVVTPVEMMYLLIFCVLALLFIGYLGRLHSAGLQVTNASQAAARAASIALNPSTARAEAEVAVANSDLAGRCMSPPTTSLDWTPSASGTWQGGSVTVTVRCRVEQQSLSGVWVPGIRVIAVSDTQPVDRYRR